MLDPCLISCIVDDADRIVKRNEHDIRMTLQNLRTASQDAKALMQALREQPSLLLGWKPRKRRKAR